jgi:hypothetical protein
MRLQRKNKVYITYALFDHVEPVYRRDNNGNMATEVIDGDQVPIEVGEQDVYTAPERKLVSFSTGGKSAIKDEYGIDDTDWNAMVMVELGRLNLDTRSLVWRNNSVTYRSDGTVDPNSAEYRVVRVLPSNTVQRYLLQKVVDGNEND